MKVGLPSLNSVAFGSENQTVSQAVQMTSLEYRTSSLRDMASYLRKNVDDGFQTRINSIMNDLPNVWVGKDAAEFNVKVKDLVKKIQAMKEQRYIDMALRLERAADDLENTANELTNKIRNF